MTEFGSVAPPHRDLWSGLCTHELDAQVGVLGVPFDGAVSYRRGTAFAPARLRELTSHLSPCAEEGQPLTLGVRDHGDVPIDLDWTRYFQDVEARAVEVLQHPLALFLGGDHSVSIPLMQAFSNSVRHPFGVLHFDAHPDLFDSYEGHKWSHACTERRALELSGLDPAHLVLVGLRSFAQEEWDFLNENPQIPYYTARQCHQQGIAAVADAVVEKLTDVEAVYLTVDIDGLDPAHAPGTGAPEGAGLTTRDLLELVRGVFQRLPVRAMDVVEVAPPLDVSDITSFAALKAIYEAWWMLQEAQG